LTDPNDSGQPSAAMLLLLCHVCNKPLLDDHTYCNNCDRPFHLRLRQSSTGVDCGEVWINEQYLALEYACDVCLGKHPAGDASEPPVARGH
jgi:predicted amidophosphoribosyltransferase